MDWQSVADGRPPSNLWAIDPSGARTMSENDQTPKRVDDVFVQLSHPRRRAIMIVVAAAGRSVELRTLG